MWRHNAPINGQRSLQGAIACHYGIRVTIGDDVGALICTALLCRSRFIGRLIATIGDLALAAFLLPSAFNAVVVIGHVTSKMWTAGSP